MVGIVFFTKELGSLSKPELDLFCKSRHTLIISGVVVGNIKNEVSGPIPVKKELGFVCETGVF